MSALLDEEVFVDNDAIGTASFGTVAHVPLTSTKRVYNEDSGLGDDEELQDMLAQRRRQALKKKKISRPEDIARNIREFRDEEDIGALESGGLVIDDTSEFVQGLETPQFERAASQEIHPTNGYAPEKMEIDVADDINDIEMPDEFSEMTQVVRDQNGNIPPLGLEDEPVIGGGSIAATLAALKRSGISQTFVIHSNCFSGELGEESISSNFTIEDLEKRQEIIARQRTRKIQQETDARGQRELERQNDRFNRLSQREKEQHREQENQARERHEAQQRMREFNDFKFDVDLQYKDEFGQEMTKKDVYL
jgi:U4/U6.U5 tri-snRNP-associated protein 1